MTFLHSVHPIFVDQPKALEKLSQLLLTQNIIAVDTESNSLHAYREQVCLIQFSTIEADYMVDPLALSDLSSLAPVFANPNIEKVFHAAEYDLICLRRDFHYQFANLFDTMMAASILGWEELGLGSILEKEFGVQKEKRFQRADWGQRPLPPALLAYARMDTHYLIPLRDRLEAELEASERLPLAIEDFNRISKLSNAATNNHRSNNDVAVDTCWRISGAGDLTPQQAAVLQELCRYRDQVAHGQNRPLFKVINDSTLLAIAQATPRSLDQLKKLPGMSPGQVQRHGYALLEAVERGLQAQPIYPVRAPRPDDQMLKRLDDLRQWRKNRALQLQVKSDVVLPRDLLQAIAVQDPRSKDELVAIMQDLPWRLEHFGEEILKVLKGRHS